MPDRVITVALADKVSAALERTNHLVSLIDPTRLDWAPTGNAAVPPVNFGHLLGHLLDCAAGFCAAFHAAFPKKLANLAEFKSGQVNHFCEPAEWKFRMKAYEAAIAKGFRLCTDRDLSAKLKTVFSPKGESLAAILLGNLEHLLNHKYQLFFYLKLQGKPVGSPDLYKFRKLPETETKRLPKRRA